MDRVDDALAGIMGNSPDNVPIAVRVFPVRPADLKLVQTFLGFASEISVRRESNEGYLSLRATRSQINQLATEQAIRRIEFDVEATDEPVEELPPGGRPAERYREFISGRYPDNFALPDDSLEEEPDPDPDVDDTEDCSSGSSPHPST